MSAAGDELTFLKKTHQFLDNGRMIIKIHPKHLEQLCKLLHLLKRLQNKRSPGHSEIETPDSTKDLKPAEASVYRSCVGILLYLSPDQCDQVSLNMLFEANSKGYGSLETLGGLHSWTCRAAHIPQMEGTPLWRDEKL